MLSHEEVKQKKEETLEVFKEADYELEMKSEMEKSVETNEFDEKNFHFTSLIFLESDILKHDSVLVHL